MEKVSKRVAWICIFSTGLMGCYSSVIVEPTPEGKERTYSGRVFSVVTKDSAEYRFDTPPTVVKDTIVGALKVQVEGGFWRRPVAFPLSDVALVTVHEPNTTFTWVMIGSLIVVAVGW